MPSRKNMNKGTHDQRGVPKNLYLDSFLPEEEEATQSASEDRGDVPGLFAVSPSSEDSSPSPDPLEGQEQSGKVAYVVKATRQVFISGNLTNVREGKIVTNPRLYARLLHLNVPMEPMSSP